LARPRYDRRRGFARGNHAAERIFPSVRPQKPGKTPPAVGNAMSRNSEFYLGEFQRTLDERFRLSIPSELSDPLLAEATDCILAKERRGCLSLWSAPLWEARLQEGVELVKQKIRAGKLQERLGEVQLLGRLLSTRHRVVQLAGRGRLVIPEGFREFLGVEPNHEVQVVGAAVCIEIWQPAAWLSYLERRMPRFRRLFDRLSQ
jgi:MraZ protein